MAMSRKRERNRIAARNMRSRKRRRIETLQAREVELQKKQSELERELLQRRLPSALLRDTTGGQSGSACYADIEELQADLHKVCRHADESVMMMCALKNDLLGLVEALASSLDQGPPATTTTPATGRTEADIDAKSKPQARKSTSPYTTL
ncbi:hypothetical protein GQ54DRAFT_313262 [Martensiomyces pterosporus]|nr:hypothetical protein GQ54DRAFT_313262 [Martensiomyces pterosporus]